MDKQKAKAFLGKLRKLEEEYGFSVGADYVEELDYDRDESPFVGSVSAHLVLVDKEGFDISVDDLMNERYTCRYCQRSIDNEDDFCNASCEKKYDDREVRRTEGR